MPGMKPFQAFAHGGAAVLAIGVSKGLTAESKAMQGSAIIVDGAHGGTRTPTPYGTWT